LNTEHKRDNRNAKLLYEATRPFAEESLTKSWWFTGSTFALLVLTLIAAGMIAWWPVRIALSMLGGLLMVRAFVMYHDFMHGAILRKSRIGKIVYHLYGLISLTPARSWRHSHNYHHANVGKPIPVKEQVFSLLTSDIGAVPLMTAEMWKQTTPFQRLRYRISRHPVTFLFAYVTVFLFSICLLPLLTNPRKFWDGALSILVHGGMIAALCVFGGFQVAFFAFILPFAIAAALGAYLFFAQHNFRDMKILPTEEWSHFRAALESSSYLKLGPIMSWFSGNIGYHHVHHLNSKIPFYRLREAMREIPELQNATVTTLWPKDIIDCLQLSLWDTANNRLISFREAASA